MKNKGTSFFENESKLLAFLLLAAVLVYARSLSFGFTTMDEQWMIVKDKAFLEKWSSIPDAFTYRTTDNYYRPLFMTSLIFDYHLGKLSPRIYHFTSLLWYLASVLLLFKLLVHLAVPKKNAFILSLLFSVHPLLLHAVAWVPGRNDVMLLCFILAALICLKRYIATAQRKQLILHVLFYACALLTKESAIILPLLFVLFYLLFKNNAQKQFFLMLALWLVTAFAWLQIRNSITSGAGISMTQGWNGTLVNALQGYLLFIGKLILPLQQSVLPVVKEASLIPGLLTTCLFIFLCFKPGLKNRKIAFFGLLMFFLLLLIPVWFGASKAGSEHYEQRAYGALAGIFIFFSQVNFDTGARWFQPALGLLFAFYFIKTEMRMGLYKNEDSFLETGMKERPDYYLFFLQKADLLSLRKDYRASLPYYNQALALRPGHPHGISNRGSAYYSLGMMKEAIVDYTEVIDHAPFNELYYTNRAHAYAELGDAENAMRDVMVLKRCCQRILDPDFEKKVLDNWIANLERLKNQLSKEQTNAALCYKISNLYFDIEMNAEGRQYLELACLLDPGNAEYREQLKKRKA